MRYRTCAIALFLIPALVISVVCGTTFGAASLPFGDVLHILSAETFGGRLPNSLAGADNIVMQTRLPRTLLAAVVGAGLSVVGVAIQAVVRNPLADPFVLGISSGASVGAAAVSIFGLLAGLGLYALSTAAFLGALLASAIVYLVARTRHGLTPLRLVLCGTALAYGFSAITTLIVFRAPSADAARDVLFWLMGSLAGANWGSLPIAAIAVLLGSGYLWMCGRGLNALAMGDETAATLGVPASRLRVRLFVVCALLTGVLVAVSGAIGFVGLMLPHLVRMVTGADHRKVLAVAPLAGACFLIWVDVASRTLAAPEELPLGVLTAVLGVPSFLLLLRRRGYQFGGQ
ncbi:FecCD family ABC transporter permease [Sciscionella sediminilitoris]|uniref:FecCD family ABC transporter permease n=1 Tax=Sciscionella sediminilitoris TaxID=1445613 RepID=UPI0004DEFC56|nr:iron ABC transporter permease [Sciscionella sp. SE31]